MIVVTYDYFIPRPPKSSSPKNMISFMDHPWMNFNIKMKTQQSPGLQETNKQKTYLGKAF